MPLGKESLLDLDGAYNPLSNPPWLWWEATEPFDALATDGADVKTGMAAVGEHMAERAAAGLRGTIGATCPVRPAPALEK